MKKSFRSLGKIVLMISCTGLLMGNKSCKQDKPPQPPPERSLKKIVDMGRVQASPLILPSTTFDFQFVANQQMYGVIQENDQFAIRYNVPISNPNSMESNEIFNISANDRAAMKSWSQALGRDNYRVEYSKEAWCMVNLPMAKVTGAVNGFELIGGGGLQIGYNPSGAHNSAGIGLGFHVEYAQLDVSIAAYAPLTNRLIAAGNVDSKQTKTRINAGINLGSFQIGPSYYYSTPLASVTKTALSMSVDKLAGLMKSETWYSRVMANHDTHLVIVGGRDLKMKVGDEFLVYNEDYYWDGKPCESQYRGGGAAANNAVAKIRLDWVGDEISRGKIIEQNDEDAVIGAKVTISRLVKEGEVVEQPGVKPPQN